MTIQGEATLENDDEPVRRSSHRCVPLFLAAAGTIAAFIRYRNEPLSSLPEYRNAVQDHDVGGMSDEWISATATGSLSTAGRIPAAAARVWPATRWATELSRWAASVPRRGDSAISAISSHRCPARWATSGARAYRHIHSPVFGPASARCCIDGLIISAIVAIPVIIGIALIATASTRIRTTIDPGDERRRAGGRRHRLSSSAGSSPCSTNRS